MSPTLVRGQARVLNEPAKVLQSNIPQVSHPVGAADPSRRVAGSHGRPSGGLVSSAASTPRRSAAGWLEEVEQHGEPELQACAPLCTKRSLPYKQGSLWRGAT